MILEEIILRIVFWQILVLLVVTIARRMTGLPAVQYDRFYFWAVAIPAIIAAAQLGVGIAQKAKAAKLARQNRPALNDNPYTETMYDLTGSRAQQGLGSAAKQAYLTSNDRNQGSSIDAILKAGGSTNNIADLYEGNQAGLRQMALIEDEARMKNVNTFLAMGLQGKADQTRDQFFLNKYAPFQDQAALAASISNQGMDNIWKGLNTGAGAAMSYNPPENNTSRGTPMKSAQVSTYYPGGDPSKILGANGQMSGTPSTVVPIKPLFYNTVTSKWERMP